MTFEDRVGRLVIYWVSDRTNGPYLLLVNVLETQVLTKTNLDGN
jgi:hypothetical protein